MSDIVTVALITALPLTIGAIVPLVLAWRTRKDVKVVKDNVQQISVNIDGTLKEFVKLAKTTGFKAGVAKANKVHVEEIKAAELKKEIEVQHDAPVA